MQFQPDWDLSSIPDELLKKEWARRSSHRRQIRRGGRKPKFRKCRFCGESVAVGVLRSHVPMCRQTQLKNFIGQRIGLVLSQRAANVTVVSITRQTIRLQAISRPDIVVIPLNNVLEISRKPKRGLSSRTKIVIHSKVKAKWRAGLDKCLC